MYVPLRIVHTNIINRFHTFSILMHLRTLNVHNFNKSLMLVETIIFIVISSDSFIVFVNRTYYIYSISLRDFAIHHDKPMLIVSLKEIGTFLYSGTLMVFFFFFFPFILNSMNINSSNNICLRISHNLGIPFYSNRVTLFHVRMYRSLNSSISNFYLIAVISCQTKS